MPRPKAADSAMSTFDCDFAIGHDARLFVMQDSRGWNLAISTDNREGLSLEHAVDPNRLRELAAWAHTWANILESQEPLPNEKHTRLTWDAETASWQRESINLEGEKHASA
jgi:hypothetical protein